MEDRLCFSVYFLRDPFDMSVAYIGVSSNPVARLEHHWAERLQAYSNEKKRHWMLRMERCGCRPVLDVVFSGLSRGAAERIEAILTAKHLLANAPGFISSKVKKKDPFVLFLQSVAGMDGKAMSAALRVLSASLITTDRRSATDGLFGVSDEDKDKTV